MKKLVAVVMIMALIVLMSGTIFAQGTSGIDAKLVHQAGVQLENYASQYYMGFWLEVGGYALTMVGISAFSGTLMGLGFIAIMIGEVVQFLAAGNIGLAGQSLIDASTGG